MHFISVINVRNNYDLECCNYASKTEDLCSKCLYVKELKLDNLTQSNSVYIH